MGRSRELTTLTEFVGRAAGNGSSLLLAGDPGVGKTTLLDWTCDLAIAEGMQVVRGSGVEYETDISFAGLHELVMSLPHGIDCLAAGVKDTLSVALGLSVGPVPARIAVLNAALSLFSDVAKQCPLLIVVDDLHVIDDASRSVLTFVARRVAGRRVGILAGTVRLLRSPDLG